MRQLILAAISLFCCIAFAQEFDEKKLHPDVGLRVPELVNKYNYTLETHTVQTKDDYLVTMHRIPHGINNANQTNKPVIFLMHGLLCSSADWVLMGPEKGLAFLLADLGYDVWMGNARGNTYSKQHATLNPDHDKKFWNFSWYEIGVFDLPAMLDYVLETTKQEKIFYLGHSQGTTVFFVMASTYPKYNDNIRLMVGLGPAAYMGHTPNIAVRIIAKFVNSLKWIFKFLGLHEFLPSSDFIRYLNKQICDEDSGLQGICNNILFLVAGFDKDQLNKTMVPVILSNTPAGAATKQLLHFGQEVNSDKFRKFDYGVMNWFHYKRFTPPEFDISKITAPIALFSGKNDMLVSTKDVDRLHRELPHSVLNYRISLKKFTHLDFLWANDVVTLLYNKVFDILERF